MTIVAVTFTVLFWVVLAGAAIIIWDYHRLVRDLIREIERLRSLLARPSS